MIDKTGVPVVGRSFAPADLAGGGKTIHPLRSGASRSRSYFRSGSLTGMWGEVLTTRGLPSVLWLLIVSRSKMNFSESMSVASMNVTLVASKRLLGKFNQLFERPEAIPIYALQQRFDQ
jgi:hypothetical protein